MILNSMESPLELAHELFRVAIPEMNLNMHESLFEWLVEPV